LSERRERTDPRHYLRLAWRRKWLLLALIVGIPAITYLVSSQMSRVYEAKTTLFVQTTEISSPELADQVALSTSAPRSVARLVETPLVANLAAADLDVPRSNSRSLLEKVSAELEASEESTERESDFLTIKARDGDSKRAAEIARAFAEAVAATRSKQASRAIDQTIRDLTSEASATLDPTERAELASQLRDLTALRSGARSATQIVDPVVVPRDPSSPKPLRNAALAFIFSLLLAAGLLPLLNRLDTKVRDPDEIASLAGAPLLAMVPEAAFPGQRPVPQVREAFQTLRASLTSFNVDQRLSTVAITSPLEGEGKTTVATNLAIALAQDNRHVILVDGDLRRCQAAARLGVERKASVGLDGVLLGEGGLRKALVRVPGIDAPRGQLRVLPAVSPPANPSVLLGSARMQRILAALAKTADIVLIDSPPLLAVGDAIPLLEHVSGVILVARVDQTTRSALDRSARVISTAGGKTLGVVATAARGAGLYDQSYAYEFEGTPRADEATVFDWRGRTERPRPTPSPAPSGEPTAPEAPLPSRAEEPDAVERPASSSREAEAANVHRSQVSSDRSVEDSGSGAEPVRPTKPE